MASFYNHQNASATSAHSTGSGRRISAHNPFRQPSGLSNYKNSFASTSTPTIGDASPAISSSSIDLHSHLTGHKTRQHQNPAPRQSVNPEAFDAWIKKNEELETLSDKDDESEEFDFVDINAFHKPSRPFQPQRAGSDSSVIIHNGHQKAQTRMSNYANNPFADALSATPTTASAATSTTASTSPSIRRANSASTTSTIDQQKPRSYRSVPPPVNRATKDLPPPSYEEAAGREAAAAPYRDEKEPSRSNGRSHHHQQHSGRSHHRHRSHSESDTKARSGSGRTHTSSSSKEHSSSGRHHSSSKSGRSKSEKRSKDVAKPKNLDTIDKLDVTGLFGGGFHHDGPFEACTPHRNQNSKAAPVAAFPADGPNSSIKGASQPIKEQLMDYAFGVPNDELYHDSKKPTTTEKTQPLPQPSSAGINGSEMSTRQLQQQAQMQSQGGQRQMYANSQANPSKATIRAIKNDASVIQFDATLKAQPVHGDTTLGLGSSTFVDGAPAPKAAQIEEANLNNSLGRKKSLVHRVKSIRKKS